MGQISEINRVYYERIYCHRSPVLQLLHTWLSFDQQSKSRNNYLFASPILKKIVAERGKAKLLDYGSGWGSFLLKISDKAVNLYGYDISQNAINSLRISMRLLGRTLNDIHITKDGEIYPDDFDLIVCSHVLEHVESDDILLFQLKQALRPGGYLLVNVPINEVWEDPKHARRYSPEVLEQKMVNTGLKVSGCWMFDRWSSFLLRHQMTGTTDLQKKLLLKILRGLLALLPHKVCTASEDFFLKEDGYQQLIMIGTR